MRKFIILSLSWVLGTSSLLASADHPLLPETHEKFAQACTASPKSKQKLLLDLFEKTDPRIFDSHNGLIVYYNLANELAGVYASPPSDEGKVATVFNRLRLHPRYTAENILTIDPEAKDRLTIPLTCNFAVNNKEEFVAHLFILGQVVHENPLALFYKMYMNKKNKKFEDPQRALSFAYAILDHNGCRSFDTMVPEDHYYLTTFLQRAEKPALDVYLHRKASLPYVRESETYEGMIEVLSMEAFKLRLYLEAIDYGLEFRSLNGQYLSPEALCEMAQSYYHTGDLDHSRVYFQEALSTPNLALLTVSPVVLMMILDSFQGNIPEDLQAPLIVVTESVLPDPEPSKGKKKKKPTYEQIRQRIVKSFIAHIKTEATTLQKSLSKNSVTRLQSLWRASEPFPPLQDHLERLTTLVTEIQSMTAQTPDDVSQIRQLFEVIKTLHKDILTQEKAIKDQIAADMRAALAQSAAAGSSTQPRAPIDVTIVPNLRAEVLAAHAAAPVKEKTTGTPNPALAEVAQAGASTEGSNEQLVRGMIQSASPEVKGILENTVGMTHLPGNTCDLLMILDSCRTLKELAERLTPGADLKALTGNPIHSHQFKINDQYRIRFNLAPEGQGFIDVAVGDFH